MIKDDLLLLGYNINLIEDTKFMGLTIHHYYISKGEVELHFSFCLHILKVTYIVSGFTSKSQKKEKIFYEGTSYKKALQTIKELKTGASDEI